MEMWRNLLQNGTFWVLYSDCLKISRFEALSEIVQLRWLSFLLHIRIRHPNMRGQPWRKFRAEKYLQARLSPLWRARHSLRHSQLDAQRTQPRRFRNLSIRVASRRRSRPSTVTVLRLRLTMETSKAALGRHLISQALQIQLRDKDSKMVALPHLTCQAPTARTRAPGKTAALPRKEPQQNPTTAPRQTARSLQTRKVRPPPSPMAIARQTARSLLTRKVRLPPSPMAKAHQMVVHRMETQTARRFSRSTFLIRA